MNTSLRLTGFVLAIALIFVAAYFIGTAVAPGVGPVPHVGVEQTPVTHEHGMVNAE